MIDNTETTENTLTTIVLRAPTTSARGEHVPYDDALIAQQPGDLFDRVLAQKAARLGQGLADDRHRQRRARHDTGRAIRQRHHALGVKIFGEDAIEMFLNKFNALDRMVHGRDSQRRDCQVHSCASNLGQYESSRK